MWLVHMVAVGNSNASITESFPAQTNNLLTKEETEHTEKSTTLINVAAKCTNSFPCHICRKYFAHGNSLYRHKKSAHPQILSGSICCQEKDCFFSCRSLQELRRHLKYIHDLCMEEECKHFDSIEGTQYTYIAII